ncbi:MAG TPA: amidohydrolase family protein [Thermoanaerobaculia bacterium]|nr:amidohydrolase family protein [Thermoanaerobaculia bacterium]
MSAQASPPALRLVSFLGLGAVLAASALGTPRAAPQIGLHHAPPPLVALVGATVVASPTETLEKATLVIEDGRVVAVGRDLAPPAGALVVDVAGKWIYPGFVDPVAEYGLPATEKAERSRRRDRGPKPLRDPKGALSWNEAIHPERRWVDSFTPDAETARAFFERGVTTVASGKRDGILRGRSFVVSLGEGTPDELVLDAESFHWGSFDKGSSTQDYPDSQMGAIALLRQTFLDARWYGEAQAAFRANPAQGKPPADLSLEALAQNREPIVFESGDHQALLRAARIGREMNVPLIHVGSQMEYAELAAITRLGAPILLPLTLPATPDVTTVDAERDVSLANLRHWDQAPSNPQLLAREGVRFAFTGAGLGDRDDAFENLRRFIERGLPKATALAALTTVPAELLGVAGQVGSLAAGRRADFLITSGDLLADEETRILSVWIGGKPAQLNEALDQVDFNGRYRLTLAGRSFELSLFGEEGHYFGSLEAGKDKKRQEADAEEVEAGVDRLTFAAELAGLGGPAGVTRFRLISRAGQLEGRADLADGSVAPVAVARLPEPTGDKPKGRWDRDEKKDEAPDTAPIARRTSPLVPFGYTSVPQAEDVLVKNATVWTSGPAGVLSPGDLLVVGGKIAAVGRNLTAPPGARVIDGTGRHLTAGLIDEHSHLAIANNVNEGSHAITAEVRIGDVIDPEDVGVYRALAGGTTAAQLLHGSANPIGGQAAIVKHRWGRGADALAVADAPPTIKLALGENVKQANWGDAFRSRYPQTRMGVETLMRDAFLAARDYGQEHRRYQALPPAERGRAVPPRRDLQLETLLEILEGRRFTHVHSYVQSEMLMLMRLAEELGFRVQTFTHVLEGYKVAREMAAHGAAASSFADWWAYKFEVWDAIPGNPCLLTDAGVVTSINSDSGEAIRRLNQEAAKAITHCGMAPEKALEMVTINPARQLRIDKWVGSLEPGKDADFVIWNDHPLSTFSRPDETWVDGARLFSREADAAERLALAAERRALVAKALAAKLRGGGGKGWDEKMKHPNWHCDDIAGVSHERTH